MDLSEDQVGLNATIMAAWQVVVDLDDAPPRLPPIVELHLVLPAL